MVSLDRYISQLESYPALPPEIHIEDMRIIVGERMIDIREQIADSRSERKLLESRTNLGRQKVFDYSFGDGREISIYVSKYDATAARERARFYDNRFHPHVGNVMLHDVPLAVQQRAWAIAQDWEAEDASRTRMDKLKNGKPSHRTGELLSREIIRYTVYTRYANGSRCHAVLTENAECIYSFSHRTGTNRVVFKMKDIITEDKPLRARYTKNCVKDAEGREIVLDDNRLTIDIRALDMADLRPTRKHAAKAKNANAVVDSVAEPVFYQPDYSEEMAADMPEDVAMEAETIIETPVEPVYEAPQASRAEIADALKLAQEKVLAAEKEVEAYQNGHNNGHNGQNGHVNGTNGHANGHNGHESGENGHANGFSAHMDPNPAYGIHLDDAPYQSKMGHRRAKMRNGEKNGHMNGVSENVAAKQLDANQAQNPASDPNSF